MAPNRGPVQSLFQPDRALKAADQSQVGASCAEPAYLVTDFVLIGDHGRTIRPRVPTDSCGQPQKAVRDTLQQLPTTTTSRQLLHQTESPQAIATGCSQQFKDLFDLSVERLVPRAGGPLFTPAPTSIRICVYQDDPPDARGDVVGTLLHGGSLSSQAETTLLNGLATGRPTTTCPTVHGQFAVVTAGSSGSYATVELGGCDRVLDEALGAAPSSPALNSAPPTTGAVVRLRSEIGQASPAAVASLRSVGS